MVGRAGIGGIILPGGIGVKVENMKIKGKNLILVSLVAVVILLASAVPAWAAGKASADMTKSGSVSVSLKDSGGTALSGVEIYVYKVADSELQNGKIIYSLTDSFSGCGVSSDKLSDEAAAQTLAAYAEGKSLQKYSAKTDSGGFAKFAALPVGAYLITTAGSEDGDVECTPMVAFIPRSENGIWVYDVNAAPKADVIHTGDITVTKLWNDDGKNRPEGVTVQLLKNGSVKDTVYLNAENNWSYRWTELAESDAWSVKEKDIPKGYTATYKSKGNSYTVINTAGLIQTGQLNWPVPVMAVLGVLLFAAGWIMVFFKGRKRDA